MSPGIHLGRTAREQSFRKKRQNCPKVKKEASACPDRLRSKHLTSKHHIYSGESEENINDQKVILTITDYESEDLQLDSEVFIHQNHPLKTLWLKRSMNKSPE